MKTISNLFRDLLRPRKALVTLSSPKLLFTSSCVEALVLAFEPSLRRQHEGVAYLLGRTDGISTVATTVFSPIASTTRGSFFVEARAMTACMQLAAQFELQLVGQIHSHPAGAYHSDGDVEGSHVRYPGYASVVLPGYGSLLPSLMGCAAYFWLPATGWFELSPDDIIIIPGAGPWTEKNGTGSEMIARSDMHRDA